MASTSPPRTPARWRSSGPTGNRAATRARNCSIPCARSTRNASWWCGAATGARPTPAASTSGSTRTSRLARGWYQGYPKKLGQIWMTRPVTVGAAGPRLEAGGVFGATLAANDRRLADVTLTLTGGSETGGFVNALPMLAFAVDAQHRPVAAGQPRRTRDDALGRTSTSAPSGRARSRCRCTTRPPRNSRRWNPSRRSPGTGVRWAPPSPADPRSRDSRRSRGGGHANTPHGAKASRRGGSGARPAIEIAVRDHRVPASSLVGSPSGDLVPSLLRLSVLSGVGRSPRARRPKHSPKPIRTSSWWVRERWVRRWASRDLGCVPYDVLLDADRTAYRAFGLDEGGARRSS